MTFAVPGVGVVDAKGKAVAPRAFPEAAPVVTGSHLRPKVDGEVRVPKHAFVVLSDAERATLLHPDDCPGCATPGWVQAHGWPLPCKCWTAATPVDGSARSERKWEGGDPVSVQEYEGEPARFHRYFCPFFEHYPSAVPF